MTGGGARPWYATAFGPHYPLLYAHRDEQEARRCLALLSCLAPLGRGPVLDLGCGEGRHLRLLAAMGVVAVGLDLSAALLARAGRAAPRPLLVRADMRRLPLRPAAATAVLSLFTTFGYFGAPANHLSVLQEIARVLRPGGHWFLDFLDSERVARELGPGPRQRTREVGALVVVEERRLAVAPRRVVKTVDLRPAAGREAEAGALGIDPAGLRYAEEVTLLSLAELGAMAAAAGLRAVAAAGDYAGSPLVPGESERWLLVYRRDETKDERA